MKHIVVIGGGAAGFFAAINGAQKNSGYKFTILEKSSTVLNKVKISGGGRCNVTHACFDTKELVKNYPRGKKQLLGPFTKFNPSHTIEWFAARGVELRQEEDGRIFPITDSSQTIIACFLQEAKRLGIEIKSRSGVEQISTLHHQLSIKTTTGEKMIADAVIITAGSSHEIWKILSHLGHKIILPVASLFTFHIKDNRITGLEGISVPDVTIRLLHSNSEISIVHSPLLITHWGMSGPAVLKLSSFAARVLAELNYKFEIEINWISKDLNSVREAIKQFKKNNPKKNVVANPLFNLPKRLWERLIDDNIFSISNYADISNAQIEKLANTLVYSQFSVCEKSTNKDEFVTCGGVDLSEVDFKTMMSKKIPNLYFAGEVLDIDAITGGFNFQAAWTTAYIVSQTI